MALMCETCKCSAYFNEELNDYACENNCPCCNTNFLAEVKKYEDILKAITDDDRDEYSENNPIFHAEQGPNRFALMSLFFNETDGVAIKEDLELGDITIEYFTDGGEIPLTSGALYEWALALYKERY